MNIRRIAPDIPISSILALGACTTPQFRQPAMEVPHAPKAGSVSGVEVAGDNTKWKPAEPAERHERGQWWLTFKDPALIELNAHASRNNADLAVAAARVRQARAIAGIAEADRIPSVNIGVGAQRAKPSLIDAGLPEGTSVTPRTAYSARLTASYEVDVFHRISSTVAATRADAAVEEANLRSVLLSLQTDAAQTYFRLRATDAQLLTVQETVRLRQENVKVNRRRFTLGGIGEFDLSRSKTELATSQAEAIGVQRQWAVAEHALAVLLGRPAANFSVHRVRCSDRW